MGQMLFDGACACCGDAVVRRQAAVRGGRGGDGDRVDEKFVLVDQCIHQAFDPGKLHPVVAECIHDVGFSDMEREIVAVVHLDILVDYLDHVAGCVVQQRQHRCYRVGQCIRVGQGVGASVYGIDLAPEVKMQAVRIFSGMVFLRVVILDFSFVDQYGIQPRVGKIRERKGLLVGRGEFPGAGLLGGADQVVVGAVILRGQGCGGRQLRGVAYDAVQVSVHLPVLAFLKFGEKLTPYRQRLQRLFCLIVLDDGCELESPAAVLQLSGYGDDEVEGDFPVAFGHGFRSGHHVDRSDVAAFECDFSLVVAFRFGQVYAVLTSGNCDLVQFYGPFDIFDFGCLDRSVAGQVDIVRGGAALQFVRHGAGEHRCADCQGEECAVGFHGKGLLLK